MLLALLLLSLGTAPTPSVPVPNGALVGTLTDATTGRPLADVIVTARSPGLEGEQLAVTDASGHYRLPQLPPGVYTLTFERARFEPAAHADVRLRLGRTVRVDARLVARPAEAVEPALDCDPTFFDPACVGAQGASDPEALALRPWAL